MTIREAVLPAEKQFVARFLEQCGLKYESDVDQTIYMEDDGEVAATVSASGNTIKCLAVSPRYRNEKLAVTLISEMIKRLHAAGIYHYRVFTKKEYRDTFISLGFSPLIETDKIAALEGGEGNIASVIEKMRVQMKYNLGFDGSGRDVGCVVINGNPFTNGHLKLVEYVASVHEYVIVFIVEEEGSYFTFKERFAMAYLALKPLYNVLVLPSSKYIVSRATFPGYFLKNADETTEEYARYDATVFRDYFMPRLGIRKRYVGSETEEYMRIYNSTLKEVLKDRLEIIPRFCENDEVISAKKVRELIKEGNSEQALAYIPKSNYSVFKGMVQTKNG